MKKTNLFLTVTVMLLLAPCAQAQINGCVNSPENPTAILGLVGLASGVAAHRIGRLRACNRQGMRS